MVLGAPSRVTAVSDPAFTGVDGTTSALLQYASGAQGIVTTSLSAVGPNRASIAGSEARIDIEPVWYSPTTFSLVSRDGEVLERYDKPHDGHGLRHQAAEVGRCLADGRTESDVLTLDETVAIMRTLDEIRSQIGLTYP